MTNKTYDVTYQRNDHKYATKDWSLVSDVCEGERKVKDKKDRYLPRPNPTDESQKNKSRYEEFLKRAVFYNATGRTLAALIGTVFRKVPTLVVPGAMDFVGSDIDGYGVSIYQQSQKTLAHVLMKGRKGLFVDHPQITGELTVERKKSENIRARVICCEAEQVINWRVENIGGVSKLTLVVIAEQHQTVTQDGFGVEHEPQFRVLRLTNGVYYFEIWRKGENSDIWDKVEGPHMPTTGRGKPWDVIPFTFVGAENNDTSIDKPPLLDLANLNIAHYRNSAWFEDSAYFTGQPQPYMTGLDTEWRDWLESQEIVIGSSTILPLPEGGTFGFAQVDPNSLAETAMEKKEEQMKTLGARLVQKGQAVKTATEAQGDSENEHSVLSLVASNVSEAYTQALEWVAMFENVTGEIEYTLSQDFIEHTLDAQMLTALVGAWQAGRLPSSDFWMQMRKHGLVDPDKTDEELDGEVEVMSSGLGLDLDDDNQDEDGGDERNAA